jgi:hypothetical protein
MRLTPRILSDDMIGLKQAAIGPGWASLRCRATSVVKKFGQAHCGRYYRPGLPTIPRSRLLFRTGKACCHPSAFSSITWRQRFRKRCC